MKVNQLKELVKSYFNLVEVKETFGELKDINGAFTLVFEGETLELGSKVKVRTAEGQEIPAPNGYHMLEDGTKIKTEGSVVVELEKVEEMVEQVTPSAIEETNTTTSTSADPMATPTKVDIIEPVNGKFAEGEKVEDTLSFPELAQVIAEIIKSEMEFVKKEMAEMKSKVEKMSAEPAVEKTLPKKTFSIDTKSADVVDPKRYAMMKEIIKTKKINSTPTN
ncbi:MAG: hypothetical protein EBR82_63360 [Caulobacteraceae bacterium]|nr:hypothetical protein [Caulobacteraceae bacterium]